MTPWEKPLDKGRANELVAELSAMPRFPFEVRGRLAVVKLLLKMCEFEHQAHWLVDRMNDGSLFHEWPGTAEMRAVYCSKWKPKDGKFADSKIYRSGIPSEMQKIKPIDYKAYLEGPDTQRDTLIGAAPATFTGFLLEEGITLPVKKEQPKTRRYLPPPPKIPITAEQIKQAVEEYRRSKG